MAQDKITEIFDIAALEANKAKFLSVIKETVAEVERLGVSIKANTSISGASSNSQKADSATKEMAAAAKEYTDTWKRLLKERDDAEKSSRRLEMANTKEVLALRKEVARQEAELRKLEIAGSKEALAVEKALAKQKADLRKLEIAGAKESLAIQKELEKQRRQDAKEQAEAAKNVFNLANAYDVLNAKHKAAIKEYQNAAAAQKLSSQEITKLKDNANKLGDQLVKIDSAVGNYRRNVGNYSSAWNGLGNSINLVARELPNFAQSMQLGILAISNNLPILQDELIAARKNIAAMKAEGKDVPSLFSQITSSIISWQTALTVGISLVLAFSKEISKMAQNLKESLFPLSDAQKAVKLYNETLKESNATKEVIADIERLSKTFELSKKNVELKKVALDDYNKTVGDVMGKTDSWAQAEQNLINKAPDFIRVTALKATATEAYSRAAAAEIEVLQKLLDTGGMASVNEFLKTGFLSVGSKGEQQALEKLMKVYEDYKKIGDSTLEEALKISNAANLNYVKQGKERVKKEIDLTNERLAAKKKEFEEENLLERQRLEQRNIELRAIIDNQKLDARERISALNEYSKNKSELLLMDSITEQDIVSSKLQKIEEIEGKSISKRTNEEKVLLLFKRGLLIEEQRLKEEAQTKLNKKNEDIQKDETTILDQESEKQISIIFRKIKAFELAGKEADLTTQEIIQNQIAFLEQSINSLGLQEDEIAKIIAKIRELKLAMLNADLKDEKNAAKKAEQIQREKYKYIQEIAEETSRFLLTLMDAQAQREITALEKTKARISEEYDLKASAVDKAAISDEERTARKLVLAAEEEEQQKKIDAEIRAIKRKQAIYDKAQALATIAINTAIAASSPTNLALGGSLTPLIIGLGAAQAAIVLATPLPEYDKGKKASDGYDGLAWISEKNKTEMKIDKDGSISVYDKPTLIHTKRGDTILSNEQLRKGELGKHIKTDSEKANYDELIRAFGYNISMLRKDVKNSGNNVIIDNSNYNLNIQRARV